MPDPDPQSADDVSAIHPGTLTSLENGGDPRLTPSQLTQWADLIANGQVRFPAELSAHVAEQLRSEVAHLRRLRLIRFIAHRIAQDIPGGSAEVTRR